MYSWLARWGCAIMGVCALTLAQSPALASTASAGVPRAPAAHARDRWWRPPTGSLAWQIELENPLDLHSDADMGIGDKTYLGRLAPTPVVYDIDGFDNPTSTVAALHRRHDHVVCYIEVGAAENYRPDYKRFPKDALGRSVPGYPAERYININNAVVVSIIKARVKMCAAKGFDAVQPDIDDSYTDPTGFTITEKDNIAYDIRLADYAHSLGLGWALDNGDSPGFAAAMLAYVDFVLDESCFDYDTCGAFYPAFGRAHKAVLEIEYTGKGNPSPRQYCPLAIKYGFDSVQFDPLLDGRVRVPC